MLVRKGNIVHNEIFTASTLENDSAANFGLQECTKQI